MVQLKERLWTKNFLIVSAIYFCLTIVSFLLNTIIILYATEKYHVSTGMGGIISGIFVFGGLAGRLLSETFSQKLGSRKTIFIFLSLFMITTGLYFGDFGVTFLKINRFLHGFTLGVVSTLVGTIVAFIVPRSRKGEGISYYNMAGTLATAFGPFIGLLLRQYYGFKIVFLFCFSMSIIGLVIGLFLQVPTNMVKELESAEKSSRNKISIEKKALPISFIILMTAFCYSSVLGYMNVYAVEIHLEAAATYFYLVYGIAVFCTRPITGALLDKKGANIVMYPAFILFGIGMLLLGNASHSATFLLASIFLGIGFGNIQSCTQVIAVNSVTANRIGAATATFFIFFEVGSGLGPAILGSVIPIIGYPLLYVTLGLIGVATIVPYYLLCGKRRERNNL